MATTVVAPGDLLPDELGPFQTAHKRLMRWAVDGTWERILAAVLPAAHAGDDIGWMVSVDSTIYRAHQHAAGARRQVTPQRSRPSWLASAFRDQVGHRRRRGSAGGRPPTFDAEAYKPRNGVER